MQPTIQKGFRKSLITASALASSLLLVPTAQAAFVMTLDDPNDNLAPITIFDGSGSDLAGVNGVITYSGSVGAFMVNVTTGVSKPVIGPGQLDLNSINVSGSAGTLLVSISDTDYTSGGNTYAASYGGTTQGSVNLSFLYGTANQAFAGDTLASAQFVSSHGNYSFSDDVISNVNAASPFSLSILAQIQHSSASQITSFDAAISPVPLPAGVWLLMSGLGALWHFRRKA